MMLRRRRPHAVELLDFRQAGPLVEAELERARRYSRPLSMVVLEGGDVSRIEVRLTDIVVRLDRARVALVAPETPAAGARVAARRVAEECGGRIVGVATFPEQGVTAAALLDSAGNPSSDITEIGTTA